MISRGMDAMEVVTEQRGRAKLALIRQRRRIAIDDVDVQLKIITASHDQRMATAQQHYVK